MGKILYMNLISARAVSCVLQCQFGEQVISAHRDEISHRYKTTPALHERLGLTMSSRENALRPARGKTEVPLCMQAELGPTSFLRLYPCSCDSNV